MLVQQVVMPASRRKSWTVLGPDGVPVERYLAFLTDVDRSPNTVKAYAQADLHIQPHQGCIAGVHTEVITL